jgi:hypothetical protein
MCEEAAPESAPTLARGLTLNLLSPGRRAMNDLISRALSTFCAGLLALAYPGVSMEALTTSQETFQREDLPPASPVPHGASECASCATRQRSARVRGYSRPARDPYAFGSPEWWEAHSAPKQPLAFIVND